ncbi:unnamed protein product [Blumeria hordei]|uniref:Uncharacterized protein n=1 Tax=Blumeria hordei TaxID=2867405 RepID=A0A383UXR6_BLUHO|nr:unnamed protein product [Blumeria hordei]
MLTSFSHTILFLGVVIHTAANSVNFVNQDGITRTIIFTPQSGQQKIDSIKLQGNSAIQQEFPQGWIGNWYSVSEGSPNVTGMLGEVRLMALKEPHTLMCQLLSTPPIILASSSYFQHMTTNRSQAVKTFLALTHTIKPMTCKLQVHLLKI